MKNASDEHNKIKIAISLKKLLESNEKLRQQKDNSLGTSYGKIALNADIRKATVSDTFNAKSTPSFVTLLSIIETMGFSLSDFAKIYESIKDSEVTSFKRI